MIVLQQLHHTSCSLTSYILKYMHSVRTSSQCRIGVWASHETDWKHRGVHDLVTPSWPGVSLEWSVACRRFQTLWWSLP